MNRLGIERFKEQIDIISGDKYHSGPQLDNAGDITYCMFLAATCVFQLISREHKKVGIQITAGNNQFFENFRLPTGELTDSNHRRGQAISFEVLGIPNNKTFDELSKKNQSKINEVENVLQAVAAGNKYFQYINEYKRGTVDGDPRNNFLMSMSGPCCPPPDEGGIWIELNQHGKVIRQGADWWVDFVSDNSMMLRQAGDNITNPNPNETYGTYNPSVRTGYYSGYIEGWDEKETAIGLAMDLNPSVEIVDLYDISEAWAGEYDSEGILDFIKDCPGKINVKIPPAAVRDTEINWPTLNLFTKWPKFNLNIKYSGGSSRVSSKAEKFKPVRYDVKGTKPLYLDNGKFMGKSASKQRKTNTGNKTTSGTSIFTNRTQ